MRKVFVTGSAGFIGYHLCQMLLDEGFQVVGFDGMTDYYDVRLKQRRQRMLLQNSNYSTHQAMLEDVDGLRRAYEAAQPDIVVHLAAQAGVRYSLENPRAYIKANIVGTFNLMELTREFRVEHLLMASTSSVYGANEDMPFAETDKTETPLTLYTGGFINGQREGAGTITMSGGFEYSGGWKAGEIDGEGVARYPNGDVYEGFFSKGQRQGRGLMRYASGEEYDGFWANGQRSTEEESAATEN